MDYYIEITLLPDPEFPVTLLMNSLYSKLHKALYDLNSTSIGISFPNYNRTLGNVLRLHGTMHDLENLITRKWIGAMTGYCKISEVNSIPEKVQYRSIYRKQATMSHAKVRRLIKRGSISEKDIGNYTKKMSNRTLNHPYIELVSASNGNKHRRYIEFGPFTDKPISGSFDMFGLSKKATIPWF
ncbi:type I-F CRISPR-associated endoribonuclease Cas6/Csy4 [Marispirochaeta sp.]|uniref:type I-F CRISPR-associated endoribonuclease Cas6/Csy4 n=1 Tax=Marispirochaeta sp. TaxID=2038653 RepID=UPI0029C94ADC|nr:type I-F CRISPR-associated endoribonuclease Cas6/Csy4 [Marispirochaeta sp.]